MANKVSLLHSAAFREWPYNYGTDDYYIGYGAVVVSHIGDEVRVLHHGLRTVDVVTMPLGEFMTRYMPDLSLRPHEMAASIRGYMSFIQPTREARDVVNSQTKIIYNAEDFDMAVKQPKTTKPTKPSGKSRGVAKPPQAAAPQFEPGVFYDVNRRTCITINSVDVGGATAIELIPLSADGLDIVRLDAGDFNRTYSKIPDYPVERAARLYLEYSLNLGGTKAALAALGRFTKITDREITMATSKRTALETKRAAVKAETEAAKPKRAAKTAAAKPATTGKAAAKSPAKTARQASAAVARERGVSAAQRFQELIMAGKMTDDKIFETVQKEFGLDDNKRSYVRWYRNKLIKDGKNPPAAK